MSTKPRGRRFETDPPRLADLLDAERKLLVARLHAARAGLSSHSGELGASLEYEAMAFVRAFLPREYGVGRGFVVWRERSGAVGVSTQLDIIIYDALRGGPLADLGTSQVYPIEHVYGYVEVKTVFLDGLDQTLTVSKRMREDRPQIFYGRPDAFQRHMPAARWEALKAALPQDKSLANVVLNAELLNRPKLLCYVIAFQGQRSNNVSRGPAQRNLKKASSGTSLAVLQRKFDTTWKAIGNYAHLSGILIANIREGSEDSAFLRSIPDHSEKLAFVSERIETGAIGQFKRQMLLDLALFVRVPPDLSLDHRGYWPDGEALRVTPAPSGSPSESAAKAAKSRPSR